MKRGNADQISATVLGEQPSLDLIDFGTDGTAKCDTTCIIDIEPYHLAQIGHRPSGGLQRVATHQSRRYYDTCQSNSC
jgi:hypothetical protein